MTPVPGFWGLRGRSQCGFLIERGGYGCGGLGERTLQSACGHGLWALVAGPEGQTADSWEGEQGPAAAQWRSWPGLALRALLSPGQGHETTPGSELLWL